MDDFTGFKTATAEKLTHAVTVMDPFHVLRFAGHALDHWHKGDPLYTARRTPHTLADLLTGRQQDRPSRLFATDAHVEVETTCAIYQRMITAYHEPDKTRCRHTMQHLLIDSLSHGVPGVADRGRHAPPHPPEAGRRRPGLLRQTRHRQQTDRGDQRTSRAPTRLRHRLPQPHKLHRHIKAGDPLLSVPLCPRRDHCSVSGSGWLIGPAGAASRMVPS